MHVCHGVPILGLTHTRAQIFLKIIIDFSLVLQLALICDFAFITVSSQALTCPVKGIVVLLKSHVGSSPLILPAHGGALGKDFTSTDHCIYIHTEQSPFWDPKQEAHSLFVR